MKTSKLSGLFILVFVLFLLLSIRDAKSQFTGEGSSGFSIPIPMGVFGGQQGKETRSLEMEAVIQQNFIADQLAVDGNIVFWVNRGGSSTLRYGKLRSGELRAEGSLAKDYSGQMLAADQGHLYWADPGSMTIQQAEIIDGNLRNQITIADKIKIKLLAADLGNLYWQTEGSQELIAGKVIEGKLQKDNVVDKIFRAKIFAVDKGFLYWVDRNTRTLQFRKLGGEKTQTLGTLSSNFTGKSLVVENNTFYWLNPGKEELCYGRVR